MVENGPPDRYGAVLHAAIGTFMSYGFKRTTMSDIADAAGMSRPALYLLFKNKNDIFRAGITMFVEELLATMQDILAGDTYLPDRVGDAVVAGMIKPFAEVMRTPHGEELFDVKQDVAADIGDDWFERMRNLIADAMRRAIAGGAMAMPIDADPAVVARLLVDGLEGIKLRTRLAEGTEQEMRLLVDLILKPMMRSN